MRARVSPFGAVSRKNNLVAIHIVRFVPPGAFLSSVFRNLFGYNLFFYIRGIYIWFFTLFYNSSAMREK